MKRIVYCCAVAAMLLASSFAVTAQDAKRITIIYDAFGAPSPLRTLPLQSTTKSAPASANPGERRVGNRNVSVPGMRVLA